MLLKKITCISMLWSVSLVQPSTISDLERLKDAYPDSIKEVSASYVTWHDGTRMAVGDTSSIKTESEKLTYPELIDQIHDVIYCPGVPENTHSYVPASDAGRIRYTPFFCKMYGASEKEVEERLVEIRWMPGIFYKPRYRLLVTTVNNVHKKLKSISKELEKLVRKKPAYKVFLQKPGGTFSWRTIAQTDRLSAHSFGMTIDINTDYSDYWQWDLPQGSCAAQEAPCPEYKNRIPWEIVSIFEKYGFIWGGKWKHYDTMHFEYRPELFK